MYNPVECVNTGGGLAQLGEHDVRNVGVAGSNPVPSTKPSWLVPLRSIKTERICNTSSKAIIACSTMITTDTLTSYVRKAIPDAAVSVTDRTGTLDHFSIRVVSDMFKGKNLLDRHRLIYDALGEPMKDGRIHALEIKAETTDGS